MNIDVSQVLTIIRYTFLQEIRHKKRITKTPSYASIITLLLMYGFSGMMCGTVCSRTADLYTAAFISSTFFMVLIANFILLEFPTLITGPQDFIFYSTKPVSSTTYFLSKIGLLFLFNILFFIAFSVPFGAVLFVNGMFGVDETGLFLSIFESGIVISLIIVNIYGLVLKKIRLSIIRAAAGIVNMILFFLIYGGYFMMASFIRNISFISIPLLPWFILLPNTWGPALYKLSSGPAAVFSFILSIAVIPLFFTLSRTIISTRYAERLSELSHVPAVKKESAKAYPLWFWKKSPEGAAATFMIRHSFKYDAQFRMGILVIIPVTILYFIIVIFVNSATLVNPFSLRDISEFVETILLYVAIGFFPFYIKTALLYSIHAKASWILFTSPYDRVSLVVTLRNFVLIYFIIPYLLVFMTTYMLFTGLVWEIIKHFLIVFLLAFVQTDIFMLFFAELPFTRLPQRGRNMLSILFRLMFSLILPFPMIVFVAFFYPSPLSFWLLAAGLLIISGILDITGRKRAKTKLLKQEYRY
ncbi:MAG: hypothetical protein JW881_11580 [Spirochaetales bacterium]|nr:hypothetical protein [Spirochaetales bacterium]